MLELRFHPFDLPLRHAFTTTHESRRVQPTLIVEAYDGRHHGLGEATATSYYGITIDGMRERLQAVQPLLAKTDWETPDELYDVLLPHLADAAAARCALDIAVNDLWGHRHGQPLYRLWNLDPTLAPPTSFTIGIASIPEMIEKMREQPWPIYKIKLGTEHDLEIVQALRRETDAVFRVDANTGWSPEQTVEMSHALKELNVEFIEQPLRAGDWEGQAHVYRHSVLPIIADESCHTEEDIERCAGYFHGVNVKLVKCGGLTPARRMISHARDLGLKTMVGCMTESSVGISAIAHLTPLLDYVDMDGALLLADEPAEGVRIDSEGRVHFPDRPGTGAALLQDR